MSFEIIFLLSFWHESIAFDGFQQKKTMIFSIFNPWKLVINNFSFPDYADLLSLIFYALRGHMWLRFWHENIAFDGFEPKKIMIFAVFNLFLQRSTAWSKSSTRYPNDAGKLFDSRWCHWKRKKFVLKNGRGHVDYSKYFCASIMMPLSMIIDK